MAKKTLGTILPNAKSLAATEAYAKRVALMKERVGMRELAHCDRRVVGGELRYYDTIDQYAIINRQGMILWFAVTPNGDVRIPG